MDGSWLIWIIRFGGVYLAVGLLFALAFVCFGVGRIDRGAESPTLGFRLLILPGSVALWPLLAWRWASSTGPPEEVNNHRRASSQ